MADIRALHAALVARLLDGEGHLPSGQRRAAFDNSDRAEAVAELVEKVATAASLVTQADIDRVRASGLSEDQVFELVICAAVGQATRQWIKARAALDAALMGVTDQVRSGACG